MRISKTNINGFTLIELLVVISIIGVLSSVVLASINSTRKKSAEVKNKEQVRQIKNALELYYTTNGFYPDDPARPQNEMVCLKLSGTCFAGLKNANPVIVNKLLPYLSQIPSPPNPPYDSNTYFSGSYMYSPNYYYNGPSGGLGPGTYLLWAQTTPLSPNDPRCPDDNVNPLNGSHYSLQFSDWQPGYWYCEERVGN